MIDANENVYREKFAEKLNKDGIELTSAYTNVNQKVMPRSYSRGTKPIMGIFASPGVDCEAYFIGGLRLGIGDHRGLHILDIPIASLLGTDKIRPCSMEGRKL